MRFTYAMFDEMHVKERERVGYVVMVINMFAGDE